MTDRQLSVTTRAAPLTAPQASSTAAKRALLIGVRTYPNIPPSHGQPLAGCHNDVAALRSTLLARGFEDADIEVLVDLLGDGCACPFCQHRRPVTASPTREGIRQAVTALIDASRPGDILVIYFSGHGSEFCGRGLQAGRRFQTLVCHDSGRGQAENRDLTDREIETWIRRINQVTPHLTMIFDCCHSGGLGDLRGEEIAGRQVRADERQDSRLVADLEEQAATPRGPSGWLRGADRSAVMLSASAAKELSLETVNDRQEKQGLFTHHLTTALQQPARRGETWADIFSEVAAGVTAANLAQHPRREGDSPIFETGAIDTGDTYPPDIVELDKLAVVIGIDYRRPEAAEPGQDKTSAPPVRGFPALRTPRRDAEEVARVLREVQGYEIVGISKKSPGPLLNEKATRRRIHRVIDRLIKVKARARRDTAVMIYFAGHGVVRSGDEENTGYLVPWDADPEDPSTWLPMKDLRDQLVDGIRDQQRLQRLGQRQPLDRLTSRHLLLVLDCCFGGALSFDFFRGGDQPDRPIFYSEYKRFVEGSAWQLLNSASANQQALDRDPKDPDHPHSPFAGALIEALTTDHADIRLGSRSDNIITATELHQFIDGKLRQMGVDIQTPGLTPLRPIEGQFIFHVPGFKPSPLADPPLDPSTNPWRGGEAYEAPDPLFSGRELATLGLLDRFLTPRRPGDRERPPRRPLVALGAAGSGKSSLIFAGLLPLLEDPVTHRRRYQAVLGRRGLHHLLISAEDLASIRAWAADLGLGRFFQPSTETEKDEPASALAETLRDWAHRQGWLAEAGNGTHRIKAQAQRQSLGIPSFAESPCRSEDDAWLRRVGLLDLLDSPALLIERLGSWLSEGGLSDFMTVSDRQLGGLVGHWRVVSATGDAVPPAESEREQVLWVIDDLEHRAAEITAPVWRSFVTSDRTQVVAAVGAAALHHRPRLLDRLEGGDPELPRLDLYAIPRPTRDELREVIEGPASAKVLFFEPADLPARLIRQTYDTPAPLPLLSRALADMYLSAWRRRRDADRGLTAADLPAAGIAGLVADQAEGLHHRLTVEQAEVAPLLRLLFLRAISFESEATGLSRARRIAWRELELSDPAEKQRLEQVVLPAVLEARLMIADRHHLELSTESLITAWPRLGRWIESERRRSANLFAVWNRALEWQQSGFRRNKLWTSDPVVGELLRSKTLNQLERSFIVASEMVRRTLAAGMLVARAAPNLEQDWSLNTTLLARAAQLTQDSSSLVDHWFQEPRTGLEAAAWSHTRRTLYEAQRHASRFTEQALHTALAATPLSVPLALDPPAGQPAPRLDGLGFSGDDLLLARLDEQVVAFSLKDFSRLTETPAGVELETGHGRVPESRRPVPEGKVFGPKAQAGHDSTIRLFQSGHFDIPVQLSHLVRPPVPLLGHRGVPSYLVFSESSKWLASAAVLAGGSIEIRLWPLGGPWGLTRQPQSAFALGLEDVLQGGELKPAPGPEAIELQEMGPLPALRLPAPPPLDRAREPSTGEGSGSSIPEGLWHEGAPFSEIDTSADGRWLAAVSASGGARVWSLPDLELIWSHETTSRGADHEPPRLVKLAFNPAFDPAFDPDFDPDLDPDVEAGGPCADDRHTGVLLAFTTEIGQPWLVGPGIPATAPIPGSGGRPAHLCFSPDGRHLASGDADGGVRLWQVLPFEPGASEAEPEPLTLPGRRHEGLAVRALAFDKTSKYLVVERQAVYKPYLRRTDCYRLELGELIRLALGHAALRLGRRHLPPETPPDLAAALTAEIDQPDFEREQRTLYLRALDLQEPPNSGFSSETPATDPGQNPGSSREEKT